MKKNNGNNRQSYIFTRETLGMTVLLFSALMLLILITYNSVFSSLGAAICAFMYGTFGYGSYLVVAALCYLGVWLTFEKKITLKLRTVVAAAVTLYMFFLLFHAVTTRDFDMQGYGSYLSQCYSAAEKGYAGYTFGGAVSGIVVYPIAKGTTFIGAYVIFSILFVLCAYLCYLVVRGEFISHVGRAKKGSARTDRREIPGDDTPVPAVNDNAYAVDGNYEIVNNLYGADGAQQYAGQQAYQPVQPQYVPQQQTYSQPVQAEEQPQPVRPPFYAQYPVEQQTHEDDKFSDKNLGRKILFDKGEFAAESYRRNMIFNDDSYFNHPVHNEGDYMSSFTGKKPAPSSQPTVQSEETAASASYPKTYSQSYSEEVERETHGPSTPSYIYGDKPADNLDDYIPRAESYEDSGNNADDYNSYDYRDDERHYDEPYDFSSRLSQPSDLSEPEEPADDVSDQSDDLRTFNIPSRQPENTSSGDVYGSQSEPPVRPIPRESLSDQFPTDRTAPSAAKEEGEDVPRIVRRGETPAPEDRRDSSNDLRSIFSSSNSNISDEIKPDTSRLSSRREESREDIFDGEDDYLTEDEPDLGGRGLRPEQTDNSASRSLRSDSSDSVSRGLRSDNADDLGVRGLRSDDRSDVGRNDFTRMDSTPSMRQDSVVPPVSRADRTPAPQPESKPEPEKPKHVWKKYVPPTLDLLADYPENNNANLAEIEDNKKLIIETLENFHIAAHISEVIIGPAITRYDVIIEDRTNIKSAMRYREAIAMALMKENVTAYLNYSKGAISIEVPNSKRTVVGLKGMLMSNEFINCKPNTLTFALGKNVEGKPSCPDITKMPHLLVAGTTGSGKSVCLSALIISLLYKYGPDELRFILVDPKQSEFISYENLPHLIVNEIISDVDKAIKALNWAIKEMERRYTLFKEMTLAGTLVKNINEYNAHLPQGEEKLPKIVVILDEFGDLMLQSKKDIESRIIRLVQKSRACGIHLILATQRPSVDCITGLIKSNLPTRIGFKVNSFDDSRTIFDIGGAEKLLGAGDLYYRSAQNPDLARIQGCFIDSPEVQAVTDFVKKNNESYFDQSVSDFINTVEEPESSDGGDGDGGEGDVKIDDKFIQALKFCVTSNQASVSMLQRRFPIGYVKACKIIDWMENMNYITQSEGSKPRKVLLSLDEFTRIYGDVDD